MVKITTSGGAILYYEGASASTEIGEFRTFVNSSEGRGAAVLKVWKDLAKTQVAYVNLTNIDFFEAV